MVVPDSIRGYKQLKQAVAFQKRMNMHLHVVASVLLPPFYERSFIREKLLDEKVNVRCRISSWLNKILGEEQQDVSFDVQLGDCISVMTNELKNGSYEFGMLARRDADGIEKYDVKKVLRNSTCPIFVLPQNTHANRMNHIILPLDVTRVIEKRLLWTIWLVQMYKCSVTILTMLNCNIEERESLAYRNAVRIRHALWESDVDCDIKVIRVNRENKGKVLLKQIKELKPGIVVVRKESDLFLADKSERWGVEIANASPYPVFAVNCAVTKLRLLR